ncbi:hypothetical protein GCM10022243_59400 [Saccharothrix violaceirubra]
MGNSDVHAPDPGAGTFGDSDGVIHITEFCIRCHGCAGRRAGAPMEKCFSGYFAPSLFPWTTGFGDSREKSSLRSGAEGNHCGRGAGAALSDRTRFPCREAPAGGASPGMRASVVAARSEGVRDAPRAPSCHPHRRPGVPR